MYVHMFNSRSFLIFLPMAAPILFSFCLLVCNARPIYIYIYNVSATMKEIALEFVR